VVAAYRKNADQPSSAQFAALAGAAEGLYRLGLWSTDSDVPLDAGYFSKEGRPDPKTVNQLPPLLMRDDMSGRLTGYMLAHDYFPTEQSYRDWVRLHDEFHPVPLNPAAQETMKAVWRANRSALPGDPFSVRQPQRQPTSGAGGTGVSSNAPASQPTINVTTVDRTPKYEVGEAQTRRGQTMQHRGDAYEGIYREAFDGAVTTYATNSKPAELFNVRLGQILDLFSGSPEDVVRKVTGVSPSVAGRIRYGNRTSEEIMGKYILHGSSDRLPDIDALRMVLVNLETAAYEEAYARRKE
jgi:hypothetical protein